jgi:hypothetical protein
MKLTGTGVMVNGQFRIKSTVTAHVPFHGLLERGYEMAVCERTDADFDRQFNTYTLMLKLYDEEESGRYVGYILNHNLYDQFLKEDAETYK